MGKRNAKSLVIPKAQKLWVTYIKEETPIFVITSDTARNNYYLYSVNQNNKLEKVETRKQPVFKTLEDFHE